MTTEQIVEWLYTNAQQGNWRVLVAGFLSSFVWFLRTAIFRPGVDKLPVVGTVSKWFKTDRGGVVLTLLVAVAGALATALAGSKPVTVPLVVSGVVNAVLAAGAFNVVKRTLRPSDQPPPIPGVRVPLTCLLALFLVGCADLPVRYDQSVATAAMGAVECKDTLSDTNEMRVANCRVQWNAGNHEASQHCLSHWRATYAEADTVCVALKVGAQEAMKDRDTVLALVADAAKKKVAETVAKLATLGAAVINTYARLGLSHSEK